MIYYLYTKDKEGIKTMEDINITFVVLGNEFLIRKDFTDTENWYLYEHRFYDENKICLLGKELDKSVMKLAETKAKEFVNRNK